MLSAFKIRAIYVIMYMGFATWRVFYNVYLEDIGLKGSEIGTLNAIMQATIFFVVAWWGILADKKGIRPTLRIAVLGTAVLIYFLGYVDSFWILLFYIPVLTIFYHPLGPLNDAMAVQFAEVAKKHSYGSFRLWGSLGWALSSILVGKLLPNDSIQYIFLISAVLFVATIPLLSTRKKVRTYKPNFEKLKLKELIGNKPLLLFFGILAFYGLVSSPVNMYINLYFTELNGDNYTVGLAYAIMAFSEVPLFLLGNYILKKFGAKQVILIAMVSMFLRFIIYGYYPNINVALAIGALQGVSLAFFLVGAVAYIQKLMPAGRHATAQSLIWGGYVGIGHMLGNLLIGFMMDKVGMVGAMKVYIVIGALCTVVTIVYFRWIKSIEVGLVDQ